MDINLENYWAMPREQALQFQGALAKLGQAKRNPMIGYLPHRKQNDFHSSHDQIKGFFGGNQSGKTTAGLIDDLIQALDAEALPAHLRKYKRWDPPFHCRIAAPDFVQTVEKVIFDKLREWIPPASLVGGGWDTAYRDKDRLLRFKNGSTFEFMTYEQDRDKWGGSTLHRVHYDEEPPLELRTEGRARLLKHAGDEIYTMTPSLEGTEGWTQDGIWDRRFEDGVYAERVDMEDNPHLDPVSVEEFLATLSDAELSARKEGKFVHYAGLVYPSFDDAIHVCDPLEPADLEGKEIIIGIDPGSRFCGVEFGAFDGDNDLAIFDELFFATANDASRAVEVMPLGVTVEHVVKRIKDRLSYWGLTKVYYTMDPSAKNNNATGSENIEAEFARFGIYARRANNQRQFGTQQINRRLQRKGPNREPRPAILIARNCRRLLWEMARYKILDTPDQHFDVVKKDDHCCDAARYLATERAWLTPLDKPKTNKGFYGYRDGVLHVPPPGQRKRARNSDYGPSGVWS